VVTVHHPDQQWWPDVGLRKQDAIDYYRAIAPVLLPHLRDRPLTLKRHYNGPRSPFEWIKDAPPELPDWIPVSPQPAKSRGGEPVRYVIVDSVEALL
jgi:bifunctional non-homologous end joining protein LigD